VANVAGAATLGCELGLDLVLVRDVVEDFTGAPGRLQPVRARNGMIAFVDYAHTDDALRNVLTALRGLKPERLLVVFGCGGDRDRTKRPRMGRAAAELADRLYLTSDNPRSEDPEAIIAEVRTGIPAGTSCLEIVDRRAAIRAAVAEARPSDLLVIAGKGHEDYQEQKGRKTPFSDVEEVRAAMAACGLL
jgi:UDP-N-acetylmuramoyl-L-alanyl-D-glutamate--2,6-diaminopimelate ligase